MSVETILQEIDLEIANLTQARNVLSGLNGSSANGKVVSTGKGRFTAAARARMAAQKARWAKYRSAKAQTRNSQTCSRHECIGTAKDCRSTESQMGESKGSQESCITVYGYQTGRGQQAPAFLFGIN